MRALDCQIPGLVPRDGNSWAGNISSRSISEMSIQWTPPNLTLAVFHGASLNGKYNLQPVMPCGLSTEYTRTS